MFQGNLGSRNWDELWRGFNCGASQLVVKQRAKEEWRNVSKWQGYLQSGQAVHQHGSSERLGVEESAGVREGIEIQYRV